MMIFFFFGCKRFPFFPHQVNDDAAQTIHHSQSLTLSFYITVFPALTLSPTAFFHPSSIITLSFLSCLSKQIAGRLLLPLWPHFETLIWIPSPSAHPLHHHSCVLPPLTQSFLTCLYVYDPMQLGEQPLWVAVFFLFFASHSTSPVVGPALVFGMMERCVYASVCVLKLGHIPPEEGPC